jgi:hypothetical protein
MILPLFFLVSFFYAQFSIAVPPSLAPANSVLINDSGYRTASFLGLPQSRDTSFDERIKRLYHPDIRPVPPKNPEQEACYTSWISYIDELQAFVNRATTRTEGQSTTTSVYVWETLQSFGPNSTYYECDGIPRIRFLDTPTETSSLLVTQTVWRDDATLRVNLDGPGLPEQPNCSTLEPYYCRKIEGCHDVGGRHLSLINGDRRQMWFPANFRDICDVEYDCKIGLSEVILIYWQDNLVTRDICGGNGHGSSVTAPWGSTLNRTITTDAITFRGQDLYLRSVNSVPISEYPPEKMGWDVGFVFGDIATNKSERYFTSSVMKGDFTFVYPTVYLAHRPITRQLQMRPRWKGWGHNNFAMNKLVRSEGIIPMSSTDVFYMRPINQTMDGLEYAKSVAKGLYRPTLSSDVLGAESKIFKILPLDYGNLREPIAASVYYDARMGDCWGEQNHCGTITEGAYRPKIRIAPHIWETIFNSYMCVDPMLVDPPISLHILSGHELDQPEVSVHKPSFVDAMPTPPVDPRDPDSPGSPSHPGIPYDPKSGQPRPGATFDPHVPIQTDTAGNIHPLLWFPNLGDKNKGSRKRPSQGPSQGPSGDPHDFFESDGSGSMSWRQWILFVSQWRKESQGTGGQGGRNYGRESNGQVGSNSQVGNNGLGGSSGQETSNGQGASSPHMGGEGENPSVYTGDGRRLNPSSGSGFLLLLIGYVLRFI